MPKQLHDKLARQARKKGYKGKRAKRYIYGTMNKIKHRASTTAMHQTRGY